MKTTLTNKRSSRWIGILFSAALLLLAISLHAQPFTRYDAQPAGSKVTLAGDSSIHKWTMRSEEHTSELQSLTNLVCRLLLEKKKKIRYNRESIINKIHNS